jgi:actin-like ATPase involved in cell morphogenesis/cbb3-type cytochrome oxidase subunit 3
VANGDRDWVVALDFGTTATAAAVGVIGGPVSELRLPDSSSTMPSSVFADGDGRLVVGAEADNEAESRLDAYEPTPKRRAGHTTVRLGDKDYPPAELIGAVMAPVLGEAVLQHNNAVPRSVVLTHPVSWRGSRRRVLTEALQHAAQRVGITELPEPVFVTEPVAAARWYAKAEPPTKDAYFAVYDLGGGTFDTTVLRATGESFEVIGSGGIDPLGGFDFDQLLFDYLGSQYISKADPGLWSALSNPTQPDPDIAYRRRRLQARVHLLKEGLSNAVEKRVPLPGVADPVVVTRREYEALIRQRIEETVTELEDTIAEAGLAPDRITAIYRIGGAARTPLVGAVMERLRLPVKTTDHPKLVVAQGAAICAPPAPERSKPAHAEPRPKPPDPNPGTMNTLLDTGGKDATTKPTIDKPAKGYVTAPPVSKRRRRIAFAIDVLPILLIYAAVVWIAVNTRKTDETKYCSYDYTYPNCHGSKTYTHYYNYWSTTGYAAVAIAALVVLVYVVWNWLYRRGKKGATIGQSVLRFKVLRAATGQPPGTRIGRFLKIVAAAVLVALVTYVGVDMLAGWVIQGFNNK